MRLTTAMATAMAQNQVIVDFATTDSDQE